ncbi:MAG: xanthan lyase, partial [Verrucomicrobiota bacterium]
VVVSHADGETEVVVNQKEAPSHEPFHSLGVFEFADGATATVSVSNGGTDGYTIIDAVQWLPVE